jgi:hypothetical protein
LHGCGLRSRAKPRDHFEPNTSCRQLQRMLGSATAR